jgi:DNA-binding LacI/PurR family transcriptional regulator
VPADGQPAIAVDPRITQSKHRPTLVDVAQSAKVAPSTASRALQDSPMISAATKRRVRAAARRLGYEPNRIARSLRTRSANFVGIVVPDIGVGFYSRVVKGAGNVLESAGYQMLVMNTERQPSREKAALQTLLEHRVDGILLATSGATEVEPRVPIVFFDNVVPSAGVANVAYANRDGIALLVDHLVGHGHSRIAYIGGPPASTSGSERLEAFRAVLDRHGLPPEDDYVRLGDAVWSSQSGGAAMRELLGLAHRPTAVVTASDTLALGAMQACRQADLRLPRDMALVSFDDPFFGDLLDPPITALARKDREIGELAASLILHALECGSSGAPTEVRLPVELVVRKSCGCG